jgi:ankyrin repeat protein
MATLKALLDAIRANAGHSVSEILDESPNLIHTPDASGLTPVRAALYHGAEDALALLRERGVELDAVEAAALGEHERLEEIAALDPGAIRDPGCDGWTPLHMAAFFGRPETVSLLLSIGADVNAPSGNREANSALHAAIAGRANPAVVGRLLEGGASPNARAALGVTPLHLAGSRGDLAVIELLVRRGATTSRTDNGQTPADIAQERGHPEAACRLRELEQA